MKKFAGYTLSTLLLVSCASTRQDHLKASNDDHYPPVQEILGLDEDILYERKGAENHELVEANADDKTIAQEIGSDQIDEDMQTPVAKISDGFLLKKQTKRSKFWIDYFSKAQRERFQRFINNGEEYRHHIEAIFESYGLPKELYYVGLIESGYYLGAKSHASAVGPWQFIKGTGKRYGLKITHEIDERRDLFKATHAAARYLKDLHNIFSSWELALAAYNAGEYGIIRRIVKHGTRDYYQMSRNKQLPSETINYVPKVIAAMHIIQNAEKYGFQIPKGQKVFDNTMLKEVARNTSLDTLSKRLGVDKALLVRLNPELKQNKTPRYYSGNYKLRVPQRHYAYVAPVSTVKTKTEVRRPETKKERNRRVASTPSVHTVKRGETLISIAKKYNTGAKTLADINGFKTWRTQVRIGQKIKLPGGRKVQAQTQRMARTKATSRPITYVVKRGDNLTELAKIFNTSISQIKNANKLKRNTLYVGQKLTIPGTRKGIYTVKKGDHLIGVSKNFNTSLDALIKINDLNKKTIYPGQKIIVNMD
ncbi:MAG TPA: LysM peptidoglycan-binding domain-containing protein [Bacteriovoracaceae bacterium]|nr:LysM peptidoglycan-binding domain-containing protein [Bacteriovoracaceae bacterium]